MTVYDKIKAGDYTTKISYGYEKIPVNDDMTVRRVKEIQQLNKEGENNHRRLLRQDIARLERQVFRADLVAEEGLTGHPKEETLWNMAWEHGHSSGLQEVANYYSELAELLK